VSDVLCRADRRLESILPSYRPFPDVFTRSLSPSRVPFQHWRQESMLIVDQSTTEKMDHHKGGTVRSLGHVMQVQVLRTPVSEDMLGRVFNGSGKPIDGGCA